MNNLHHQHRGCPHMNKKRAATALNSAAALHALELVGNKGWDLITQVTTVCILAVSVFGFLLQAIP